MLFCCCGSPGLVQRKERKRKENIPCVSSGKLLIAYWWCQQNLIPWEDFTLIDGEISVRLQSAQLGDQFKMGSFNSKAASKQYPIAVNLPKAAKTNTEERTGDGESVAEVKKCTKSDGDVDQSQNPLKKWSQCKTTSEPKRTPSHASYLWLASSPITQDEENLLPKESAVNRFPEQSTSANSARSRATKEESVKSVRFRPMYYSYPKVSGVGTNTQPSNGEKRACAARNKGMLATSMPASPSAMTEKTALYRSIGFGVDKALSHTA